VREIFHGIVLGGVVSRTVAFPGGIPLNFLSIQAAAAGNV